MEKESEILRKQGIRVTPQRLAVYSVVIGLHRHLGVSEVYNEVQRNMPAISLATVYSILEIFRDRGLVRELKIDFERSFYEARLEWHHHFFCRKCKRIFDIDIDLCPTLRGGEIDGHVMDDFHGYFYGECKECRKNSSGRTGR